MTGPEFPRFVRREFVADRRKYFCAAQGRRREETFINENSGRCDGGDELDKRRRPWIGCLC
jgi:hypothetical protein